VDAATASTGFSAILKLEGVFWSMIRGVRLPMDGKLRRPLRKAILVACLAALALWIAVDKYVRTGPASPSGARVAQGSDGREASSSAGKQAAIPERPQFGKIGANPFSTQSWLPPPPKAVSHGVPAAPVAPPLPYRFAGQLHMDTGIQILLARGDEITVVKEGDILDGQYKVESIDSTKLALVHMATGTRQLMEFGPPLKDPEIAVARNGAPLATQAPLPGSRPSSPPLAAAVELGDGKAIPGPAQLRWDGPSSAKAGARFNVVLRMTSGERIRSAPMLLKFDPAVLESVSVKPGRYFDGADTGNFGYRINPDGSIFIGVSNRASTPTSDAEILVLTFKPIRAGAAAEVSVASLNLQAATGRTVAYGSVMPFKTTITP
jgi:hypothetical protein